MGDEDPLGDQVVPAEQSAHQVDLMIGMSAQLGGNVHVIGNDVQVFPEMQQLRDREDRGAGIQRDRGVILKLLDDHFGDIFLFAAVMDDPGGIGRHRVRSGCVINKHTAAVDPADGAVFFQRCQIPAGGLDRDAKGAADLMDAKLFL